MACLNFKLQYKIFLNHLNQLHLNGSHFKFMARNFSLIVKNNYQMRIQKGEELLKPCFTKEDYALVV